MERGSPVRGQFKHNPVSAWRRRLVALSSCHLVVLLALTAGSAAAQAPPGDVIYSRQGSFRIPFQIDPGERRIQQVQLHVSEDQGRNWSQYASALPTEKFFNYQTNRDATYWFTVRTVTRCAPTASLPVENTRLAGSAFQPRRSIRYHCATRPSAAFACGAATWKYSCAEAVCRCGVPLTNAVRGAVCTG